MKLEISKYLYDIKVSIDTIEEFVGDERDFFKYKENKMLRRAVEREIEIIGEAMSKVLKLDPGCSIKNARKIVDTRNWVIHSYDNVDDIVIWNIISKHLPKLKVEINELLK